MYSPAKAQVRNDYEMDTKYAAPCDDPCDHRESKMEVVFRPGCAVVRKIVDQEKSKSVETRNWETQTPSCTSMECLRPNYIVDYRDWRLPCLCVCPECPEDTPMAFKNLPKVHFYDKYRIVTNPDKVADNVKRYPTIALAFYEVLQKVKKQPYRANLPLDGKDAFSIMLGNYSWRTKVPPVAESLIEKLWRLAPQEYRARIEKIVLGLKLDQFCTEALSYMANHRDDFLSESKGESVYSICYNNFTKETDAFDEEPFE